MMIQYKRGYLLLFIFLISSAMLAPSSYAQHTLFNQHKVIHLFNGRNLAGWYTYLKGVGRNKDPDDIFTVQGGMIRIAGKTHGCITTTKAYRNYKLIVEYRWGDQLYGNKIGKARDSGILLHSVGKDGAWNGTWMHSIEVNIIEGGTGDFIVVGDGTDKFSLTAPVAPEKQPDGDYIFQRGGDPITIHSGRINNRFRDPDWKNVTGFRGDRDHANPLGEWNRVVCIVSGRQIYVYVNGTLVNHAIYVKPEGGRIQLQAEGAEIYYRRVDLVPLPPYPPVRMVPTGYKPLFNGKNLSGWTIHGGGQWYVDDNGNLVGESGPGGGYSYLATEKEYKDFILKLQFKQEEKGNSGVFFHSFINGTKVNGWQVEIAPPGHHSGGIYESYGRGWLVLPNSAKEAVLKFGQWNTMTLRVKGDTVDTWLNGVHMVHHVDHKMGSRSGHIALQVHKGGGVGVKWRNIELKKL